VILSQFGYKEGDFPITKDVGREEQIEYVVGKLKEGIKNSV